MDFKFEMRSWEMIIILKEHIFFMRHRQTQRSHSKVIANAWSFEKIQISVKSYLVVNLPLNSGHNVPKSLHSGNVLIPKSLHVPDGHGDFSHHPILLVFVPNGSGGCRRQCVGVLEDIGCLWFLPWNIQELVAWFGP